MSFLFHRLLVSRTALSLIALATIGSLALAFISQYGFDLQPCVLCIYQRWPPAIAAALCLFGLTPWGRALAPWLLSLAGLAAAVNIGIAGYHVGVEQQWWAGTASCVGQGGTAQTVEALRAQIMATPVIRCDEVAFSLFGISMAGYNVLFSAGLTLFAAMAAVTAFKSEGTQ